MLEIARSRLGLIFSIGVSTILTFAMLLFYFISTRLLDDFGKSTISLNETAIMEQTKQLLHYSTMAQAEKYSAIFQQAANMTAVMAKEAELFLDNIDFYGTLNINVNEEFTLYPNGMYSNKASDRLSVIIANENGINAAVQKQVNALSHLDPLLIRAVKSNPMHWASYLVTKDIIVRYYPNTHYVGLLPPISEYDYFGDPYYNLATPKHNPERRTVWTKIVEDMTGKGLMTTVSSPIYRFNNTFYGVVSIDITLNAILSQILAYHKEGTSVGYKNEFHLLVDQNADVISLPPDRLKMFGLEEFEHKSFKMGDLLSINLMKSTNSEIREIGRRVIDQKSGVNRLILGNGAHLIAYHQIPVTGWTLGIAIPEHELLQSIYTTRKILNRSLKSMSNRFVLITIAVLIITIIGTLLLFKQKIFQPIQTLIDFTKLISNGKTDARIKVRGKSELNDLATAFNQMADDLQRTTVSRDLLEEKNTQLALLSNIDGLTGLFNRRYFDQYLIKEWKRLERIKLPLSLIMCDIDHFKLYNDTYGHQAGDECIRQVAKAIRRHTLRSSDIPARYGGEEFAVILPQTDSQTAYNIADCIRKTIRDKHIEHSLSSTSSTLSASFGVATLIPDNSLDPQSLVSLADEALYKSKDNGRDQVICEQIDLVRNHST